MKRVLVLVLSLVLVMGMAVAPAMATGAIIDTGKDGYVIRGEGENGEATLFTDLTAAENVASTWSMGRYVTQHTPLIVIGPSGDRLQLQGYMVVRLSYHAEHGCPTHVVVPIYRSGVESRSYALVSAVTPGGGSCTVPPEVISYVAPFTGELPGICIWYLSPEKATPTADMTASVFHSLRSTENSTAGENFGIAAYVQEGTLVSLDGVQLAPDAWGAPKSPAFTNNDIFTIL